MGITVESSSPVAIASPPSSNRDRTEWSEVEGREYIWRSGCGHDFAHGGIAVDVVNGSACVIIGDEEKRRGAEAVALHV